jgi:2-dehydro-3-deoxyglucarate aldolase/4-hydroxy-2-oxoheptanedioate aldolase
MRNLKQRMTNGEALFGTFLQVVDHPDIIRILKTCGFDFVIIDNEHGSFNYSSTAALIGMCRALDLPVLIRISEPKRKIYSNTWMLVPTVYGCQTATMPTLQSWLWSMRCIHLWVTGCIIPPCSYQLQCPFDPKEYMKSANEANMVVCQIESAEAVENIDAILAVDGVDAVFIGPKDLSQSLGVMGIVAHPKLMDAIKKVGQAAKRHGKHAGIAMEGTAGPSDDAGPMIEMGYTFNAWSSEVGMITKSANAGLAVLRNSVK